MNILITSCSKKVLLVKSFKTYVNNQGGKVYATDININSPALYFADEYFLCPRSDEPKFINFLIKMCRQYEIKLIIPTSCRELKVFALNKDKFSELGCKVMICSPETVEICQNKLKFVKYCQRNGIPIPLTFQNKSDVEKYPVFTKPISGSAGQGIKKINNLDELKEIDLDHYLIQEFVDWKEYTIDYLSDFEGNYINCIPRERINVVNGESCVSIVNDDNKIKEKCQKLGEKLGLVGHNTIQCFSDGHSIKFIEINPRFGGASNLGINAGLESPKILIDLLVGNNFEIKPTKNKLMMLRYSTDIFGYLDSKVNTNDFRGKDVLDKIYCIDIDGTLCTEQCEYKNALPLSKVINKINALHALGNKIILFTSRGYKSKKNWRDLTEEQLQKWGVKYHELIFNKPYADYYIDNKAINILDWI